MSRTALLAAWAAIGLLLVGCEVLSVVTRRRYAGALELLARLTAGPVRFVVVFLGWMWLGWHFFAR